SSAKIEPIEQRVELHAREGRGKLALLDGDEPVLLVEAMSRVHLRARAEADARDATFPRVGDERGQKRCGNAMRATAKFSRDEHLSQRGALGSVVEQTDGADHPLACLRDPEAAAGLAVERRHVVEVGLVCEGDGNAELASLDAEDVVDDALAMGGCER